MNEAQDATHLVLEASGGGTLIEAIANSGGRLPERVAARRIVAPLLRALAHLHVRGIVHRCVWCVCVSRWSGGRFWVDVFGMQQSTLAIPLPHITSATHHQSRRDIKPEHVMLTRDGLRIIDLSTAAFTPNSPPPTASTTEGCLRTTMLRRSVEKFRER